MKVQIKNLGVIDEAEMTLKPLTVLVGPNNAGKTWLAYTIAGILGSVGWLQYTNAYINDQVSDVYVSLNTAIDQVYKGGDATIDLVQFIDECGETYINNVAAFARQWMRAYLGTTLINFEQLDVRINLEEMREEAKEAARQYSAGRKFGVGRGKP